MMEQVYLLFFALLVFEAILFAFLNLPTPRGWKSQVVSFLTTNPIIKKLMKAHVIFLIVALIFCLDCFKNQTTLQTEKAALTKSENANVQLRKSFLSYSILKIQRNKYITCMLVYMSAALHVYIKILQYMYEKRDKHEQKQKQTAVGA